MSQVMDNLDRRRVLQMIAAGAAASVAGCKSPNEAIYPYVNQPEGALPGSITRYASAITLAGYARGVTGLVTDGRPIKLEGLAGSTASLGATDLFTETALLDLYDPQRLQTVSGPPGVSTWEAFSSVLHSGQAAGRLALLTGRITSPTLRNQVNRLRQNLPDFRHVEWEPFNDDNVLAGTRQATGKRLLPRPRFADAQVVLLLGADPLGPGPEQVALARAWARRRRGNPPTRLYAAESSLTNSGVMADFRLAADPQTLASLCHELAAGLGDRTDFNSGLDRAARDFATKALQDLLGAHGRALILVGPGQPPEMHGFAAWANARLAAPIDWLEPVADAASQGNGLAELAAAMHAGAVDTLLVLDSNPVYSAPPALDFAGAMRRVRLTAAAGMLPNETAAHAQWRLPLSHELEEWTDARAPDGAVSIGQPLVQRFYDTRAASDVLALLSDPAATTDSRKHVREQWQALSEEEWQAAVASAMIPDSAASFHRLDEAKLVLPTIGKPGLALEIRPSPTLWDGRRASNAWAQECPDPVTKEVWGSSARMHAADMTALALEDGDEIVLEADGRHVVAAALAVPGQAKGVITLLAGYGRRNSGAVADGIGTNAFALVTNQPIKITPTGARSRAITSQNQFKLTGELDKIYPILNPGEAMPPEKPKPSLLPNPSSRGSPAPQWAMTIDTDICIGCNACVVACQAENNVPVIGPEESAHGRDMHWLRVDRYDVPDKEASGFQPVPCMHCEKAPCEPVCPVEASVHNSEGLNLQVYNRCIGTRTCEANCPYRVRRFNFFDYSERSVWGDVDMAPVTAQRNPDVTVRGRGVMEKCTYCLQRISAEEHDADAEHRPVGEVVTACQSACPTQAITFGRIDDETSTVSQNKRDPRHFALLGDLGTGPRTTYLARTINRWEKM